MRRFESSRPSQPVRSLLFDFWLCDNSDISEHWRTLRAAAPPLRSGRNSNRRGHRRVLVKQYQQLFAMEGVDLTVAEEALGAIARRLPTRRLLRG